ncbi:MBL fold metallo-hydrolase [Gracilibacillus sp. S3-1-1]|uniref:MBL fold metallo-hydrolase n=1 Tax=Gracilibacillus pellucidus TaxID=3095368 RepID=A0ACC6M6H9_9BACI|nr:MBL fold metallo-hydrolase [Gracilibacillus sp. S3-1-1]MDX8046559.1 MBL fold metallo-hydrolase [Gracilibacillus sp. S3-1-1]
MSETKICFWSGLRTIGGNIAEIRYGNDRVIFDFGLVYNPATSFVNRVTNRQAKYVSDLLRLDAIPRIDGLYRRDRLKYIQSDERPLPYEDSVYQTAVFISHMHLDHMGAIDTIAPEIPVLMSKQSKQLYDVLDDVGEGLMRKRKVEAIAYENQVQIGEIRVTPYQTDHDAYGAMAMLVETPDLTVLYSGDFRMHGQNPQWNMNLLRKMDDVDVDLLLIEGTTFRPEQVEASTEKRAVVHDEQEFAQALTSQLLDTNGLAFFNLYHRNIDRINHFINGAQDAGRTIVLELETAHIADQLINHVDFAILDDDAMKLKEQNLYALQNKYRFVTSEEINEKPTKYIVQNSFGNSIKLLDYVFDNSIYIHANGMPLGAFDPEYQVLLNLLEHLDIRYQSFNISGHAYPEDVLEWVDRINPELLIPWHSHYPELIKPTSAKQAVFLPKKKTWYQFEEKQLKEIEE